MRTHIDTFFRSLAEDQAERAIGVVLSGAGSDGTLGLKAIKEHGGITMVQSPASAKYDSMPLSAIATGLLDFTVPVAELPAKLVEHAEYLANPNPASSSRIMAARTGAIIRFRAFTGRVLIPEHAHVIPS